MNFKGEVYRRSRKLYPLLSTPTALINKWFPVAHRGDLRDTTASLYSVYRSNNVDILSRLIGQIEADVHLHSLDGVVPDSLSDFTRSTGPGQRMPLLQSLITSNPPKEGGWVVIADDDVAFEAPGLTRFLKWANAAGLDFAQPAHTPSSHSTFLVTRLEPFSSVRQSQFVEVGPLVALSPRAQAFALPFPEEARMGWGVDVLWASYRSSGLRLGVVDATPMRHFGPVGNAYDNAEEAAAAANVTKDLAVTSAHDLDAPVGLTWRPWQRTVKWIVS